MTENNLTKLSLSLKKFYYWVFSSFLDFAVNCSSVNLIKKTPDVLEKISLYKKKDSNIPIDEIAGFQTTAIQNMCQDFNKKAKKVVKHIVKDEPNQNYSPRVYSQTQPRPEDFPPAKKPRISDDDLLGMDIFDFGAPEIPIKQESIFVGDPMQSEYECDSQVRLDEFPSVVEVVSPTEAVEIEDDSQDMMTTKVEKEVLCFLMGFFLILCAAAAV